MFQIVLSLLAALAALAVGVGLYRRVLAAPTSTERANEIAAAIRSGAEAFLSRQYRTVAKVGVPILFIVLLFLGKWYAFGFLVGSLASAAATPGRARIATTNPAATSAKTATAVARGLSPEGFRESWLLRRGIGFSFVEGRAP